MSLQFNPFTGTFDVTTKGDTGAVAAAGDGSAAAPGITFASDTNTGIYRPGADQLALSTNGTGRLFIDASGNINIGGSDIGVLGSAGRRLAVGATSAGNNGSVTIFSSTSGLGYLAFGDGTAGSDSYRGLLEYDHTSDSLRTYTAGTQRMAITSTGQLSHIGAGSSGSPAVSFSGSAASNSLVVDSNSRVGVGTSSPAALLHLSSATGSATPTPTELRIATTTSASDWSTTSPWGAISFYSADASDGGAKVHFDIATIATNAPGGSSDLVFRGTVSGSTAERLRITSGGLVGIGTTGPNYELHVNASDAISGIQLTNTSTGTTASDGFLIYNNGVNATISNEESGYLRFQTAGLERAQIDSSGRLLVGTSSTSAGSTFVLQGNTASSGIGIISLANTGSSPVNGEALGVIRFTSNTHNAAAAILAARDAGTWTSGSSEPTRLTFFTTSDASASPTERLRITSAGVLQVADAGNIAVGTTTGTKIGTATTQKLGFFNKTPVVQPAAVADATDAASVITQLNALLARMRDLGLIAT